MSKCEFSANDGACISPFAVRIEICTYMLPTGSRPHRVTMKVVLHKALLRAVSTALRLHVVWISNELRNGRESKEGGGRGFDLKSQSLGSREISISNSVDRVY